jgi:hypothetical protein
VLPVVPHDCGSWLTDPTSEDQAVLPECRDANDTHCWSIQLNDIHCGNSGSAGVHFHPFAFPFPATARLECVIAAP